ncbi:MAG: hypothetical protein NT066_01900, partial [Candidatus Omnitrophica bacterium]|nr:hypothetical protein [Candidatus Omnitrophota bacterium]
VARGVMGEDNLKKVALEKEVKVDINSSPLDTTGASGAKEKTVITCDGPLEIDYDKNVATFNNNVKVERPDVVIYSDKMDVFFTSNKGEPKAAGRPLEANALMGNKVDKIIARGNVKVVRGENISYSDEATYSAVDKKLVLNGRPRLIMYSTEGLNAPSGN